MIRIHVISGAFPPNAAAGAKSFFKLIYPLNQDPGFRVTITAICPSMFKRRDESLFEYVTQFRVNYVKWCGQPFFKKLNRNFQWYTDHFALFALKCRRIVQTEELADLYLLRGQPHSIFTLGSYIRQKLNRPVVLFYSDPWLHNPYHIWSHRLKKRTARMEALALKSSSGVIFTNRETQDKTSSNYPNLNMRSIVIPHTYMSRLYKNKKNKIAKKNELTITFAGSFYGRRQPFNLFKAISELKKEKRIFPTALTFKFIGPNNSLYQERIRTLNIEQHVQFLGHMDYLKTLNYLQKSDILLNIDAPSDNSLFLPSKLVDYLGCNLPIWTLSPPGPAASLVREYGGLVSWPDDVAAIKKDLLFCLKRTVEQRWHLNLNFTEQFDTYKSYPKLKFFLNSILDDWRQYAVLHSHENHRC